MDSSRVFAFDIAQRVDDGNFGFWVDPRVKPEDDKRWGLPSFTSFAVA